MCAKALAISDRCSFEEFYLHIDNIGMSPTCCLDDDIAATQVRG
jgi:hypothetical protein